MRRHLTRTLVERIKPVEGKSVYVWDDDPKALAIRVTPNGHRAYVVCMRTRRGVTKKGKRGQQWERLGEHGAPAPPTAEELTAGTARVWTPETARVAAKRLLGLVATGIDPSEAKRAARGAPTLAQAARDYIEDQTGKKRASTLDADLRLLGLAELREEHRPIRDPKAKAARRLLDTPLAALRLPDIRREDIEAALRDWRATPIRYNRALALLSHLLKWAGIEPNPCKGIVRNREKKRERFLSGEELQRLGKVLAESKTDPRVVAAIRLALFTGARRSELLGLRWEHSPDCLTGHVDFALAVAVLHQHKTDKPKHVVLPPPALVLLKGLKRRGALVFEGDKPGRPIANLGHAWGAIRKAAGLEDVRPHDLRHSFASVAASGGVSLPLIGGLLGHSQPATTARYAHLAASPLHVVAKATAATIAAQLDGKTPAAVLPMRRRRRG